MKRRFPALSPARRPSTRRVSAALAGVAVAVMTAGCQMFSPIQTDTAYQPADGVLADVGQLALRDLVLVGDGSGPAVISGSAINLGDQTMTVKLAPQAAADATTPPAGSEIELTARQQVDLATKGLQLSDIKTKPGGIVPMTVTSSQGGTTVVKVPVLSPQGYYATVTPAPTGS